MEEFFDFVFAVRWWHWLAGMAALAGLYYLVAGVVLPHFKRLEAERLAEGERKKEEAEEEDKRQERQQREAVRRKYLKQIPSGPVEPVDLPRALVRARNRSYQLPTDAETVFGTQRGVAVPIMSRGVSRQHAKIRPEARGYVLYDLRSEAGTLVGGERVEAKVLADGDVIRIGPAEVLFKLGKAPPSD